MLQQVIQTLVNNAVYDIIKFITILFIGYLQQHHSHSDKTPSIQVNTGYLLRDLSHHQFKIHYAASDWGAPKKPVVIKLVRYTYRIRGSVT